MIACGIKLEFRFVAGIVIEFAPITLFGLRERLDPDVCGRSTGRIKRERTRAAHKSRLNIGETFRDWIVRKKVSKNIAHARNFLDCVKSRQQPLSDLESGHQIATACHLSNISLRLGGRKLVWDADHEEVVGDKEANAMLVRPYRAPWDKELKALRVG